MTLQEKINEIWKEPPQINFPQCLIDKLKLEELHVDLLGKADKLKDRIMQRKEEEGRKKLGLEALKQKEADDKAKEKEAKREMIAKRLEEKKKSEQKRLSQMT